MYILQCQPGEMFYVHITVSTQIESILHVDFGHCPRMDKSGHPGVSQDVKGHLRP